MRFGRRDRASNHRSLPSQGDLASAKPLYERAIAIGEKALGPEHPDLAVWLNNFAGLLRAQVRSRCAIEPRITALFRPQGDLASAKPLLERAIAIGEKTLGPEHPNLAIRLNNFALLLKDQVRSRRAIEPRITALFRPQGDLASAKPLYERAIAIGEKTLGPEHPDLAKWLNNLALLLKDQVRSRWRDRASNHRSLPSQGDLASAQPLLERAIAITEKALGPEHPNLAKWLNNLALLLWDMGRIQEAIPHQERATKIREVRGETALAVRCRRELDGLNAGMSLPEFLRSI